jgi:hypothetical protein
MKAKRKPWLTSFCLPSPLDELPFILEFLKGYTRL